MDVWAVPLLQPLRVTPLWTSTYRFRVHVGSHLPWTQPGHGLPGSGSGSWLLASEEQPDCPQSGCSSSRCPQECRQPGPLLGTDFTPPCSGFKFIDGPASRGAVGKVTCCHAGAGSAQRSRGGEGAWDRLPGQGPSVGSSGWGRAPSSLQCWQDPKRADGPSPPLPGDPRVCCPLFCRPGPACRAPWGAHGGPGRHLLFLAEPFPL